MADSATTPEEPVVMDGDVIVEFNEASSRQQINSGESVKTLFGKIRKFLTDLKAVAFSGAYSDLSGAPDLSAYAKKTDVPNIKVNSAVNADMVGEKLPEKIFYDNGLTSDLDSATKSGCYAASPDTLNAPFSSWWLVDTANFDNQFIVQKAHAIGNTANTISYIRNYVNSAWSDWTEIYTAGNKPYVTGVVTISGANDTDNLFRIETNHGFAPSWALCCNIADNIVYCCALSSDNPTRFIYLRSTEAIKNGDIFEYIIFR